jgi:ribosome-binding factor A
MENKRQAKFARQMQKDLSEIFQREGKNLTGREFIGVSGVKVTPDFGYVKVYLTFLNEQDPQKALNMVKQHNKEIRTLLASRIKNEVRKIPELEFFYDDTLDMIERIDRLFDEIKNKEGNHDTPGQGQ